MSVFSCKITQYRHYVKWLCVPRIGGFFGRQSKRSGLDSYTDPRAREGDSSGDVKISGVVFLSAAKSE